MYRARAKSRGLGAENYGMFVVSWWDKLCIPIAFYTHTYVQQLAICVQDSIYAQFKHFLFLYFIHPP